MCAFLFFSYNLYNQTMGNDKEKTDAYITPEIDKLVKQVIETDDEEEAEVIAEILNNPQQNQSK